MSFGSYDLFVDLSDALSMDQAKVMQHARRLLQYCGFGNVDRRINIVLPKGVESPTGTDWGQSLTAGNQGALTFDRAVEEAAMRKRGLLVITGLLLPANEVLLPLWEALCKDPLFGSAQPRFANALTDEICPFPSLHSLGEPAFTSRQALSLLPEIVITAELLSSCTLLRREVVAAMGASHPFGSVRGALALGLCVARRRGFRNVVSNRAVVSLPADVSASRSTSVQRDQAAAYLALAPAEMTRLLEMYPDHARANMENSRRLPSRLEWLLTAAHPGGSKPRRLLLDCRGMAPVYNGTSQAMVGLLDGLASLKDVQQWHIDVQSGAAAAKFHGLAQRYPMFTHVHGEILGPYAAVLMPNQPWSVETVAELHRSALVVIFNILDTIAWDILYPADDRVESTWQFVAAHADGLAYISSFTQDRFRRRFPVKGTVQERVIHLSLDAEDHTIPEYRGLPPGDFVLLFGNAYEHKDLAPTLQNLSDAFPLQQFVVLGAVASEMPRVKAIASGQTSDEEIHRLIATAKAIVFPSYYEGFGLPVVESLAYGRPVLVRKSVLWDEISAHSRLSGRMIEFDDTVSLVEGLGRVLADLPVAVLPASTALVDAQDSPSWRTCAASSIAFVDHCVERSDISDWLDREEVLKLAKL
ncbi:hypothetical protein ASC92_25080 [Variovorax sp. Root411]|nr:hypothetical protein ASC92_25080 [Variovorax sp. Root411]